MSDSENSAKKPTRRTKSPAGLVKVTDVDLTALRERRLAAANAGDPDAQKAAAFVTEPLTAEQYMRRVALQTISDDSDEVPIVRLLWRSTADGKGRVRVNYYSKSHACFTRSEFYTVWPNSKERSWHHERQPDNTVQLNIKDM